MEGGKGEEKGGGGDGGKLQGREVDERGGGKQWKGWENRIIILSGDGSAGQQVYGSLADE